MTYSAQGLNFQSRPLADIDADRREVCVRAFIERAIVPQGFACDTPH
jgi:hypothetical protein